MIRLLIAALLASSLFSCNFVATGEQIDDHWDWRSTMPRINRYLLGYDAQTDGTYRDFQWDRKKAVELDLRRHFFNHNPDNPNHPEVLDRFEPRKRHSLLRHPVRYIHMEGLVLGFAAQPLFGGFIPLPIDSILGTVEEGGWSEFIGSRDKSLNSNEVISASVPAPLGVDGESSVISTVTEISGK